MRSSASISSASMCMIVLNDPWKHSNRPCMHRCISLQEATLGSGDGEGYSRAWPLYLEVTQTAREEYEEPNIIPTPQGFYDNCKMDIIPLPKDSAKEVPRIAYVFNPGYDLGDFLVLPSRTGWSVEEILRPVTWENLDKEEYKTTGKAKIAFLWNTPLSCILCRGITKRSIVCCGALKSLGSRSFSRGNIEISPALRHSTDQRISSRP